jgi:hypothetical protein
MRHAGVGRWRTFVDRSLQRGRSRMDGWRNRRVDLWRKAILNNAILKHEGVF